MNSKRAIERVVRACLLACALLATSSAAAQAEDYKGVTQAAVEEYGLGHWDEALALFAKAHEIEPNARTFWGMGIASFEARRYADAMRFSQAACDDPRKRLTDAQRKQAESVIKRASDFLVRVKLDLQPDDARISVDGSPVERDKHGLLLLGQGPRQLVLSAEGYEETVRTVEWAAGSSVELQLRLVARAPAGASAVLRAGSSGPVSERDGDQPEHRVTLQATKWSALGLSVASLAFTGAGIAVRQNAAKRWNDERECPVPKSESCGGEREKANHWRVANVIGGGAAAVFAALAVTLFVLDRPRHTQLARALRRCTPGTTALGLDCHLHF